jgi:hypothetical protein
MKKTIAKIMAAAMLVASLPAMAMPTLTLQAAPETFSASYVKFNGSYDAGKYFTMIRKSSGEYETNATTDTLILKSTFGMTQTGTGIWNTHLQYFNDGVDDIESATAGTPSKKLSARTLTAGTESIKKENADLSKVKDYYDNTGVVKSAALDGNGELILTINETLLTDAKKKDLAAGNNNTVEFTPWVREDSTDTYKPVFTIQIGEVYTANKTSIEGCSTPDGFIKEATVVIKNDQTAELIKVSDNDKKVAMKGQKIEVSEVEVGGVTYPIRKFEEQCLKNAKMKRLTAKQVKNIETGAVRGCKRLTRVTMGNTKIKKIHSNAFLDCEKLKNIKINCKNLKAVGSKAFKGLKKNCVISIKAKKAKYNSVVKMIKKSGTDQVKFKRV